MGLVRSTKRTTTLLLVALASLASADHAAAQLGSWTEKPAPDLGSSANLTFQAGSGVVSTFSSPSVHVGPYSAFLTSDPTKSAFTVYCVDFLHSISAGAVWTANVTQLTGALTNTRLGILGAPDPLLRYQMAAWLAARFALNQSRAAWTGLHDAIWSITTPGYALRTAEGQSWQAQVTAAFAGGVPTDLDWQSWSVVTDVKSGGVVTLSIGGGGGGDGVQEFLVHSAASPVVTPEPETYLLLATGMFGLLFFAWRRREGLA